MELRVVRTKGLKEKTLALGHCERRSAKLAVKVPVLVVGGRKVAEFRLHFWPGRKLETEQEVQVRQVAQELGERWPRE